MTDASPAARAALATGGGASTIKASSPSQQQQHDTSIVRDVFGNEKTHATISERDQQIVLAQLQNLVMALRTNAKFRRGQTTGSGMRGSASSAADLSGMTPTSGSLEGPPSNGSFDQHHQRQRSTDSFDAKTARTSSPTSVNGAQAGSSVHPLVHNAVELRHRLLRPLSGPLSGSSNRRGLTDLVLLAPFLDVMCSSETTEPISAVAMVAVITFLDLSCSFITPDGLVKICEAARTTRGEVMDVQSHDAFLARIIQVFVACFRHAAAAYVPEELPVTVFHSVMRIGAEAQSELLRRVSEQGMNDIVSACYGHAVAAVEAPPRLLHAPAAVATGADVLGTQQNNSFYYDTSAANATRFSGLLRLVCKIINGDPAVIGRGRSILAAQLQGLCLAHTALLVLRDNITKPHFVSLLSVARNELPRALLQVGKHSDHVVVLAQVLRTMHLLFSFASIELVPQLVSFMRFILRRGGAVLTSGGSTAPAPSNNSPFHSDLPLHSPKRLDSSQQFEAAVTGGHPSSGNSGAGAAGAGAAASSASSGTNGIVRPKQEELHIESLWEFCSHEAFPAFVMHHIDLSLESSPLFYPLCQFLSESVVPPGGVLLAHVNVLPLDCLLVVLNHMHARVARFLNSRNNIIIIQQQQQQQAIGCSTMSSNNSVVPIHDSLKKKKYLKGLLDTFIATLGGPSPKNAVRAIYNTWAPEDRAAFGLPASQKVHGTDIGRFLFKYRMRLDPPSLAAYVGELGQGDTGYPDEKHGVEVRQQWLRSTEEQVCKVDSTRFFHELRRGFMSSMSFRGKPLLLCLRELCFGLQVSGEAQKIDRIMEEFSLQWYEANVDAPNNIMPFKGKDAPFILAFSTIMLNTDLHLANIPKKMTREEFIKRNRLIDVPGATLPDAYLGELYDDVKSQQIVFVELLRSRKANGGAAGSSASRQQQQFEEEDADFSWAQEMAEATEKKKKSAADTSSLSIISMMMGASMDDVLVQYDPFVLEQFWPPCAEGFWRILNVASNVLLPVPPPSSSQEDSLREALAFAEQKGAPVELLESVNRGVQSLALTGARLGIFAAPDALVQGVLDTCVLSNINLATAAATPYSQVVQLGQRICPLFQLDTLFRGYLVDVVDTLTPAAFTKLAKSLLLLLLCGGFAVSETTKTRRHSNVNQQQPQQQEQQQQQQPEISDLLTAPSVVATPPPIVQKKKPAVNNSNSGGGGGGGGWFFGVFGGGSDNGATDAEASPEAKAAAAARERKRAAEEAVEKAALSRLRSSLPTLVDLFAELDRFSPAALSSLVNALVQVIDDGSLVVPRWKDELLSIGTAFLVEILIQCPSHNSNSSSSSSPHKQGGAALIDEDEASSSSPSLESVARSFLEAKLADASSAASSNIIKSILRYAPHASGSASATTAGAGHSAARVLKLVSSVQSLPPAAFAPVVHDILSCIEGQLPVTIGSPQKGAAPAAISSSFSSSSLPLEDKTWCAILRTLRSAARVQELQSDEELKRQREQQHQAMLSSSTSSPPSSPAEHQRQQQERYEPRLHALSILGRIVRNKLLPLSLSVEAAETAASFSLLDIPSTRFVTTAPAGGHNRSISGSKASQQHEAQFNNSSNGSGGASGSFVEDQFRPISILAAIHDRLLAAMGTSSPTTQNAPTTSNSATNNAAAAATAAKSAAAEATDIWLRFVVAVTMAMVAAAEHASTHAALELLNALSGFVCSPNLAPIKAVQLLEGALLPVVDRVCTPFALSVPPQSPVPLDTPTTSAEQQQRGRNLSMFSPTDLLTYMLGPLAGPETPAAARKPSSSPHAPSNSSAQRHFDAAANNNNSAARHRCADEVKSGVLRLVATATLNFFDSLAAAQKSFVPLWERVLMSFYAIYTRQPPHEESADVREAIQYTVLNLVRVTATTTVSGSGAASLAMHPQLWKNTREMLRRFDFGQTLDAELGKAGFH